MKLTLQTYLGDGWHDAAVIDLVEAERGHASRSTVEYDIRYFADWASIDYAAGKSVRDFRAYSVAAPVNVDVKSADTWPPFVFDLIPQGRQAKRIAEFLKLPPSAPSTEIKLLEYSAGSPVGNLRIKEANVAEMKRVDALARVGVTMDNVLKRDDVFLEVANHFSMLASGSNGLQGDWPKVAMTCSMEGLWYPDPMVADADARKHVIVKLPRSNEPLDGRILEAEAGYSRVARDFGVQVEEPNDFGNGVLIIPRFDRFVTPNGLLRYGQESIASAMGIAGFGTRLRHEACIAKIQEVSADPLEDTVEYLLRDILNLAMGNPDNHGRNTALQKFPNGNIRLAPLFDFAPMRLDASAILRSTTWECMARLNRDNNPDWRTVCEAVARPNVPADVLMERLAEKADDLRALPELARKHKVADSVIQHAIVKNEQLADEVAKLRSAPKYG